MHLKIKGLLWVCMDLTLSNRHSNPHQMVLLAPSLSVVPEAFTSAIVNPLNHKHFMAGMQRLRGALYLEDGAIHPEQLTADGRHELPIDDRSWHLLTLDRDRNVTGCSRYLSHPRSISYHNLEVTHSALAASPKWGRLLEAAIEAEIALARKLGMAYAEVGGWAVSHEQRCTTEALRIALATYTLANLLGGCIGVSTATVRNCSASILKRLGGVAVNIAGQILPSYYDPQYDCEMEILRFDSRHPAPRFQRWMDEIRLRMLDVPVICAQVSSRTLPSRFSELPAFATVDSAGRAAYAA